MVPTVQTHMQAVLKAFENLGRSNMSLLTRLSIDFPLFFAEILIRPFKYVCVETLSKGVALEFLQMGNCSLKGVSGDCPNSIRVLTDSGSIMEYNDPKLAGEVLIDYPGYGIFLQGKSSSPVPNHERLLSGKFYYLLPIGKPKMPCSKRVTHEQVPNTEVVESLEPESAKKSSFAASEFVESLSNGSALEVLPSGGDGVWKVKLVIDTKQLEEILSEQGNTEALIERMRMVASSASPTPRHAKSLSWRPSFSNLFKVPH